MMKLLRRNSSKSEHGSDEDEDKGKNKVKASRLPVWPLPLPSIGAGSRLTTASARMSMSSKKRLPDVPKRVEWVPDRFSATCMSPTCDKPFTLFRRRHHCRNCGKLFCGDCTERERVVTSLGTARAVRVCDQCAADIDEAAGDTPVFVLAEQRPSFAVASDNPNCWWCERSFGLLRHRHHCHHCGGVYCADCSQREMPIPSLGYEDPVCTFCADNLDREFERYGKVPLVPLDGVDACMYDPCQRRFGLFDSKVNCRNCGDVFCSDHAAKCREIPDLMFFHPVPVCVQCADKIDDLAGAKRRFVVMTQPPQWQPDQDAPVCGECERPFTLTRRRHHCRHCGYCFDATCSSTRVPIPLLGYSSPVRVCDFCAAGLKHLAGRAPAWVVEDRSGIDKAGFKGKAKFGITTLGIGHRPSDVSGSAPIIEDRQRR